MRKIFVILFSLFISCSCNSNEEKATPKIIQKESAIQSDGDTKLQELLKGKEWTAENDMAPMSMLKLKADGNYDLKSGNNPGTWKILGGKIALDKLTEWPIEKVNDSSFRLYVKPTDKWYMYKQTGIIQ